MLISLPMSCLPWSLSLSFSFSLSVLDLYHFQCCLFLLNIPDNCLGDRNWSGFVFLFCYCILFFSFCILRIPEKNVCSVLCFMLFNAGDAFTLCLFTAHRQWVYVDTDIYMHLLYMCVCLSHLGLFCAFYSILMCSNFMFYSIYVPKEMHTHWILYSAIKIHWKKDKNKTHAHYQLRKEDTKK